MQISPQKSQINEGSVFPSRAQRLRRTIASYWHVLEAWKKGNL